MSTAKELRDQWSLLMAAEYPAGHPKAFKRRFEHDPAYAREVTKLGVQVAEAQEAERSRPQLSETQAQELAWLDRATGAKDKSGVVISQEMSERGTAYRSKLHRQRQHVLEGRDISDTIAMTERDAPSTGWKIGAPARVDNQRLTPPQSFDAAAHTASQPINTQKGPQG